MIDWQPVFLSLKIAGIALLFVTILGLLMSAIFVRYHFPGKAVIETFLTMPLVLPPVVTGFILLLLIGRRGPVGQLLERIFHIQIVFTPIAAIFAATIVSFPLLYQSAKAAFQGIDPQFEQVARTLGASELKIFFTITLPLAWPGILSGMVMAFARAMGEFGATAMVAGNIPGRTQTIPIAIYFATESNNLNEAAVYVLVIGFITFIMVFGVNRWSAGKTRLRVLGKEGDPNVTRSYRETAAGFSD